MSISLSPTRILPFDKNHRQFNDFYHDFKKSLLSEGDDIVIYTNNSTQYMYDVMEIYGHEIINAYELLNKFLEMYYEFTKICVSDLVIYYNPYIPLETIKVEFVMEKDGNTENIFDEYN